MIATDPAPRRPHPRARTHRRTNRWIAVVVSLAIVIGLVALSITKIDLTRVGHALANVSLGWVLLGFALMASSFVARGESWFAMIRAAVPDSTVGRGTVRRGLLIGMAGSTLAPGRAGEAVRAWVVARRLDAPGKVLGVVVGTILSQTLLNLLALSILAAIALTGAAITGVRIAALAGVIALPAGLLALLLLGPRLLQKVAPSPARRLGRATDWVIRQLVQIRRGLSAFRRPRPAAHASLAQLVGWTLQLGTCYAVLRAFGGTPHAAFAAAAAVLVAVNLTAIVPVTPSNVGVFQAACIAALAPFGVAASEGLAYGLILQGVEIVAALALGIPALLQEGLSWDDVRRKAPAAGPPEDEVPAPSAGP